MKRVAVITAVHGNLPAPEAALEAIGCGSCTGRRKVNECLVIDKPARTFERIGSGTDCSAGP